MAKFNIMPFFKPCTLIFGLGLICGCSARSQNVTADSLVQRLSVAATDSERIELDYRLDTAWMGYDMEKASHYLDSGLTLSEKIKSSYFISKYVQLEAALLTAKARYDDAQKMADSAIGLFQRLSEISAAPIAVRCKTDIAQTLITKGLICAKRYQYFESIENYIQSLRLFSRISDPKNNVAIGHVYTSISSNYYELEQFENALTYDKLALAYFDSNLDIDLYVIGHLFVADDFSGLSGFDSSFHYLKIVEPTVLRLNKPTLNVRYYYILAGIYRKRKQWQNALDNYQKSEKSARSDGDDFQQINAGEGMAACYLELHEIDKARVWANFVIDGSDRLNIPLGKMQGLQLRIRIEDQAGNIRKAFADQTRYLAISDSVKKEKTQIQMNEVEARYQSEKKQNAITELEKDKKIQSLTIKQESTINFVLFGSLAGLLLLGLLLFRNYRQKQQLQQQRIIELEKDHQLTIVDAMLKGQEEERTRLARDLHDGLGGMLSGVKYSLNHIKDKMVITPDNIAVYERSVDMIDFSIRELRRVAHNMMPEMLTRFGLDEALKDYCHSLASAGLLSVRYQSFGLTERQGGSSEIIIYRIVQELLNNTLKHAGATEALVQLVREDSRLSILVEDNGKGFDVSILDSAKGAGWTNIRSRVDYLKGAIDVHTEPGKGTSVSMEFNL